jgi:hypothetical protein
MRSASCRFGDGTGLVVHYSPGNTTSDEVPYGTVWTPGGTPFVLLTETPLRIGNTDLPIGGYRIYLRPEREGWSLIVNDGVSISGYDAQHDLARVGMQSAAIEEEVSLQAHYRTYKPKYLQSDTLPRQERLLAGFCAER